MSQAAVAEPVQEKQPKQAQRPKRQPRFNVILWNDEDHSYQFVIAMMQELFGYQQEQGFLIAKTVDTTGRAIVLTTTKEHAELKRDQIHAYGRDPAVAESRGSMWSTIEEAP